MEIKLVRHNNYITLNPAAPYLTKYMEYSHREMKIVHWRKETVFTKKKLYDIAADGGLVTFRGFFEKIKELVETNGDTLEVTDVREQLPPIDKDELLKINFREHQFDLVNQLLTKLQDHDGVCLATMGAGKTHLSAAIYASYNSLNTILAVPLKAIALQTYNTFKELFPNKHIGLCADGVNDISTDITICTFAGIEKCSLEKCKLLMVDEIQGTTSERMQRIITSVNAIRNIGFTATDKNFFNKADNVVTALFGGHLCEFDYSDGEDIGAVVPCTVYFLETEEQVTKYGSLDSKMKYGLKCNADRNALIGEVASLVPDNGQCMVFVDHVRDHLPNVVKSMPHGTRWLHRTSSKKEVGAFALTPKQQKTTLQEFADGEFKYIVVTDMARAGVSVDNVRCVIQASGGTSEVEILQEFGRGSRIITDEVLKARNLEPKTHCVLIDFKDNHDYTLAAMSNKRRKIYLEQGWTVVDVKTPQEIDWNYYK